MDRNSTLHHILKLFPVALRKESVDRNFNAMQIVVVVMVALRKESVDRNADGVVSGSADYVALRKESVDRNNVRITAIDGIIDVALRKESVDRNARKIRYVAPDVSSSLSARRAWIEIWLSCCACYSPASLSARRAWIEMLEAIPLSDLPSSRSPQGERG